MKCDEEKPTCKRCRSTKRQCDGYQVFKAFSDALHGPRLPLPPTDSPEERRSFAFFLERTAPALTGFLATDFWTNLLPRACHQELSIKHALIAVSSMHEAYEPSLTSNKQKQIVTDAERHRYALKHYNHSIGHLTKLKATGDSRQSIQITLIACVLFTCIEYLENNVDRAMAHMQSGVSILTNWRSNVRAGNCHNQPTFVEFQAFEDSLVQMLKRAGVQLSMFGQPLYNMKFFDLDGNRDQADFERKPMRTLLDARVSLDKLFNKAMYFTWGRGQFPTKLAPEKLPEAREEQAQVTLMLQQWLADFETFIMEPRKISDAAERLGPIIMRIQHRIAVVWVAAALESSEDQYDKYLEDYKAVVSLGKSLLEAYKAFEGQKLSNFSFDMEAAGPVYFAALKCRDPSLRRQAVSIVKQLGRREGLWDCDTLVKVAERIIAVEEEKLQQFPDHRYILPSEGRVYNTKIDHDTKAESRLLILFMKPDGPKGEWHLRREYI